MAMFWGWKQRKLYTYIMLQADNENAWEFSECRATHRPSGIDIWMSNGFWFVDIYDWRVSGKSDQNIGFSLVQKWKIHRKLKKIKQKFQRMAEAEKRGGFESKVDYYMAEMVGGTLSGEKNKK